MERRLRGPSRVRGEIDLDALWRDLIAVAGDMIDPRYGTLAQPEGAR
jgi:hypothetical protein